MMPKAACFGRVILLLSLSVVWMCGTSLPASAVPITDHTLTLTETEIRSPTGTFPGEFVAVGSFSIVSSALTPNTFIAFDDPNFLSFSITVPCVLCPGLGRTFTLADARNPSFQGVKTDETGKVSEFFDNTCCPLLIAFDSPGGGLLIFGDLCVVLACGFDFQFKDNITRLVHFGDLQIDIAKPSTFVVAVKSDETIPLDPANSRVFVRFKDDGGVVRGATSVAVQTQ